MSFKGQVVWVRADDGGRPVLDADGRAEMKYRESDTRSYRPLPQNLEPNTGQAGEAGKPAARPTPRKPRAEKPAAPVSSPSLASLPSSSSETVHVWTDGACSGNPGPMGIGIVVVAGDRRKEHGEYLGRGTNNIAELTAIRRGLEIARSSSPAKIARSGCTPIRATPSACSPRAGRPKPIKSWSPSCVSFCATSATCA